MRKNIKAKDELNAELNEEELSQIMGGTSIPFLNPDEKGGDIFKRPDADDQKQYDIQI